MAKSILCLVFPLSIGSIVVASAQTKIEARVVDELRSHGVAHVLIVTRPDPDQPGGGAFLSSPASHDALAKRGA